MLHCILRRICKMDEIISQSPSISSIGCGENTKYRSHYCHYKRCPEPEGLLVESNVKQIKHKML